MKSDEIYYDSPDGGKTFIKHDETNFILCCKEITDDTRKCSFCRLRFKCFTKK